MQTSLAIILGSVFTIIIVFIEYVKLFQLKKKIEALDWLLMSIALFNGVGFSFVIWSTFNGYNIDIWASKILRFTNQSILIYYALNLVMVSSVILGWTIAKSTVSKRNVNLNNYGAIYEEKYKKKVYRIAWVMLIVGILSYMLYSRAYGGFSGLIYYSRLIRSGITVVQNSFSFLQRFGSFTFFSSYIFLGLIIDKTVVAKKRMGLILGFIISFLFSIFVLYTWVGRVSFIVYLATLFLGVILYKSTSIFRLSRKLIKLLIFSLVSIVLFDRLLNRSKVGITIIELFTKELSFPAASFISQLEINSFRWFKDILVSPLYILPSRIWNVALNLDTASMENTYSFWGAVKGQSGVTGSIPVDFLTFSFMQASVIGVIVVGIMWGFILVWIQNKINRIHSKGIRMILLGNVILNVSILSVLYGDPLHIITRNFGLIAGMIILSLANKIKWTTR